MYLSPQPLPVYPVNTVLLSQLEESERSQGIWCGLESGHLVTVNTTQLHGQRDRQWQLSQPTVETDRQNVTALQPVILLVIC